MPRKKEKISIHKKHLILCEGMDAWRFLICYLNSPALQEESFFSEDIEVLNFGGNEELSAYLTTLKGVDGYSDVISLLVIRDAELDAQKATHQVQDAFRASSLEIPSSQGEWVGNIPKTCFLLFHNSCALAHINSEVDAMSFRINIIPCSWYKGMSRNIGRSVLDHFR